MTRPEEQQPCSGAEFAAVPDAMAGHPAAERLRRHSYALLRPRPGAPVVDVGCGTGGAVAEPAERGARAGRSGGRDRPRRADAHERPPTGPDADLRQADAYALPPADGSMLARRAGKVFHELAEPARALGEARRVLRAAGSCSSARTGTPSSSTPTTPS
ncbi:methyltransferase domain-containing protein [Streptomyces sp. NPDC054783]